MVPIKNTVCLHSVVSIVFKACLKTLSAINSSKTFLLDPCLLKTSATISFPSIQENLSTSPSLRLLHHVIDYLKAFSATWFELSIDSSKGLDSVNIFNLTFLFIKASNC